MAIQKAEKASSIGAAKSSFFSESVTELKKVSGPTKDETITATRVVIVMMIIISIYLGVLDLLFNRLMLSILS